MRPICEKLVLTPSLYNSNPGLPVSLLGDYNEWQKLPLREDFSQGDGSPSPTFEAAMKPVQSDKKPFHTSSADQTTKSGAVETRAERLERIKREIADGSYDTDEKLEKAIERMLGVL